MKRIIASVLAASFLFSLTACGSTDGASNKSTPENSTPENSSSVQSAENTSMLQQYKGGELVIPTNQSFNSMFNPYESGNTVDWGWPCMEPLGYKVPGQSEWQLLLAESFDVDQENATVTIKVRDGVKFHDGDTLDAEDVAFSIQAWNDFGRGTTIGSPTEVRVIDDLTVEVQYDAFSLNFQDWLLPCWVYSKQTYDSIGADAMLTSMNGTGPYIMDEYIPDVSISYVRNENYWQEHNYGPDTIKFLYMAEETTTLAAFLSNEVSYMRTNSAETVDQLKGYGFDVNQENNGNEFVYYAIPMASEENNPLYSADVRRAIYMYGIDWDAVSKALLGDLGYHTDAIGQKNYGYYSADEFEVSTVDYEKAKELLAQAGYPEGFSTTIYTDSTNIATATILQAELKKINVNAEVETIDMSILQTYMTGAEKVSGIVVHMLGFTSAQMDRFNKFYSYKGSLGGGTIWSDEEKQYYDEACAALSQEDQNAALANYVKQMVQIDSNFWPIANAPSYYAAQTNLILGEDYHCGLRGWDPMKVAISQ